jgi:LacI family transcriptional regulator
MPKTTRQTIALLTGRSSQSDDLLAGVARFSRFRPDWVFPRAGAPDLSVLREQGFRGLDGIIAAIAPMGSRELQGLRRAGCPVVNVLESNAGKGLATVCCDERRVGALAADYLADRGLKRVCYLHYPGTIASGLRGDGFRQRAAQRGAEAEGVEVAGHWSTDQRNRTDKALKTWIEALRPPAGVLAFDDPLAIYVLDHIRRAGLHAPQDIAVIGVNNDEALCALAHPPLASIDRNGQTVGYEAAALLDRLLSGQDPPEEITRIPPAGVIERESADLLATDDEDVRRAIAFIRQSACSGADVADVLDHVVTSRRSLDRKFVRIVGCTVEQELWRVRLEHARMLLTETDWPIVRVAASSGFATDAHFSRRFRGHTGLSPRAFRARHRRGDGS